VVVIERHHTGFCQCGGAPDSANVTAALAESSQLGIVVGSLSLLHRYVFRMRVRCRLGVLRVPQGLLIYF